MLVNRGDVIRAANMANENVARHNYIQVVYAKPTKPSLAVLPWWLLWEMNGNS